MSERAQLALEGASLEAGESIRLVCPFCGGGSTRERSLVLTLRDDGALLYVCHRANCTGRGRLGGLASLGDSVRKLAVRPAVRSVVESVGYIPSPLGAELALRYHFRTLPDHWRYDHGYLRLLFPVLSPKWQRRGWVSRNVGGSGPKSLNEKELLDQPWLHWAHVGGRRVFVVEDIPSAERLAEAGEAAVALMGSHMADDCADEIVHTAHGRPVVVALDRDATAASFAIGQRLSLRVPTYVKLLRTDVKDMTQEELTNWLNADC